MGLNIRNSLYCPTGDNRIVCRHLNIDYCVPKVMGKGKGKTILQSPITGPQGSSKFRLSHFGTVGT
jgi:hypothetical protein